MLRRLKSDVLKRLFTVDEIGVWKDNENFQEINSYQSARFLLLLTPFLIMQMNNCIVFNAIRNLLTNSFFTERYNSYSTRIGQRLKAEFPSRSPRIVYDPARYALSSGGKRVRAVLLLLACEAVGGTSAAALPAACAIEVLHNFTLVHDDIMDHAALRRGRPTVHAAWDTGTAILAGDEMVAHAYRLLLQTPTDHLPRVTELFTRAFIDVCDGQGYDKEYEQRRAVRMRQYMQMIGKKTGAMFATAAELGGCIGNGSRAQLRALRTFGAMVGRAFQIRDDLLDISGEERKFGKSIGGDIREGKKTFLLIEGLRRTRGADRRLLERVVRRSPISTSMVKRVRDVYERAGVIAEAERNVARCTQRALEATGSLPPGRAADMLRWVAGQLIARSS